MKTNIQIFEEVARHLLTQKEKSKNEGGAVCRYLTEDGKKCAVGCLINPELYDPKIENALVLFDIEHYVVDRKLQMSLLHDILTKSGIPHDKETYRLLRHLQDIHDDYSVDRWMNELSYVYSQFFNVSMEKSKKFVESLKGN